MKNFLKWINDNIVIVILVALIGYKIYINTKQTITDTKDLIERGVSLSVPAFVLSGISWFAIVFLMLQLNFRKNNFVRIMQCLLIIGLVIFLYYSYKTYNKYKTYNNSELTWYTEEWLTSSFGIMVLGIMIFTLIFDTFIRS